MKRENREVRYKFRRGPTTVDGDKSPIATGLISGKAGRRVTREPGDLP